MDKQEMTRHLLTCSEEFGQRILEYAEAQQVLALAEDEWRTARGVLLVQYADKIKELGPNEEVREARVTQLLEKELDKYKVSQMNVLRTRTLKEVAEVHWRTAKEIVRSMGEE
jgi:hypothetical protein